MKEDTRFDDNIMAMINDSESNSNVANAVIVGSDIKLNITFSA